MHSPSNFFAGIEVSDFGSGEFIHCRVSEANPALRDFSLSVCANRLGDFRLELVSRDPLELERAVSDFKRSLRNPSRIRRQVPTEVYSSDPVETYVAEFQISDKPRLSLVE